MSWLFVGDSILCGMGPRLAAVLAPSITGNTQCHDGATAGYWQERIGPLLAEQRPEALVYVLGTNDDGERRPDAYTAQVLDLVSAGRRRGIPIIWIGPVGQGGWQARGEIIRRVVTANGGTYIDGGRLAAGLGRAPDGIGFTDYETLADRLAASLPVGQHGSTGLGMAGAVLLGAALTAVVLWLAR